MKAKSSFAALAIAAGLSFGAVIVAAPVIAAMTVMVGGAPMYPTKNIIENAVNSADHTTLVAAVKAAGLVETLEGPGPFTKVLTYHVVSGRLSASDLKKQIKSGNGTAELTTVEGGKLWASQDGNHIMLKDEKGGTATVTIPNVFQSNGVIHVIDTVVMPN